MGDRTLRYPNKSHPKDPLERFNKRHTRKPNGCWEWTAGRTRGGYSFMRINNRQTYMHRWSYEHFIGPIPEGRQIHHTCENRACVNPEHLAPLTQAAHSQETSRLRPARSHCANGHEMTPDNSYYRKGSNSAVCRRCNLLRARRHYDRRRRKTDRYNLPRRGDSEEGGR